MQRVHVPHVLRSGASGASASVVTISPKKDERSGRDRNQVRVLSDPSQPRPRRKSPFGERLGIARDCGHRFARGGIDVVRNLAGNSAQTPSDNRPTTRNLRLAPRAVPALAPRCGKERQRR